MYYIVNVNNQIVAADQSFLDKLGLKDIPHLYQKIAQGDISLQYEDDVLKLTNSSDIKGYEICKTPLNSLLGDLYIIELKESQEETINNNISDDQDDEILKDIFNENNIDLGIESEDNEEELISLVNDREPENIDIKDTQENILLEEDFLLEDNITDEEIIEEKTSIDSDDEIFDLLLTSDDNAPLISPEQETTESEVDKKVNQEPIYLDIDSLSQTIGISVEDYQSFLDEYKETALNLQQDIRDADVEKRASAIQTLQHLSDVLHIPVINEILDRLSKEFDNNLVDELYDAISRITTEKQDNAELTDEVKEPETIDEETIEEKIDVSVTENDVVNKVEESVTSKHKIDLSDVKPIHFDFSMEQAANELSLPVDLIDEFVHDFIEQAHEETENMLTAYDKGDLDKINKLGHLLKGTSSNLRITPLADTLYKIQFCESLDELEPLIKDYWGHFLAFENHIKMRTN